MRTIQFENEDGTRTERTAEEYAGMKARSAARVTVQVFASDRIGPSALGYVLSIGGEEKRGIISDDELRPHTRDMGRFKAAYERLAVIARRDFDNEDAEALAVEIEKRIRRFSRIQ